MSADRDEDGNRQSHRRAEWLLPQLIAARGIRPVTKLQRLLVDDGVKVSRQQISKIVARMPSRVSVDLLAGLARVLQCGAGDLIRVGTDFDPGGNDRPAPNSTAPDEVGRLAQGPVGVRSGAAPAGAGSNNDADVPGEWLEQLLSFPFRPYPLRTPARPGEDRKRRS